MGASAPPVFSVPKVGNFFFLIGRAESHNKININPVTKLLLILQGSGQISPVLAAAPSFHSSRRCERSSLSRGRDLERVVASTRPDLAHPHPHPLARRLTSIKYFMNKWKINFFCRNQVFLFTLKNHTLLWVSNSLVSVKSQIPFDVVIPFLGKFPEQNHAVQNVPIRIIYYRNNNLKNHKKQTNKAKLSTKGNWLNKLK